MKLEKNDPDVEHIYALHTETKKDLDHVVLVAKYGLGFFGITSSGADKVFNKRFFDKDAMYRVRHSPPFVEMSKKIEPLLEEPSEVKYGRAVLGFETRLR